ncbi:MAG: DUF6249 domain-containing protein [bacterium]
MNDANMIVATTIPMFSLMVVLVIVVVAMILKSRADGRRHKERMLLAEKGMEIPPQLYDTPERRDSKPNGYRTGRVWLLVLGSLMVFIGLGVIVFGAARGEHAENGLVPLFIGLGFLAAERMIAKMIARSDKTPDMTADRRSDRT